ncbi:hypothetical protein DCAR_0209129 [Daucus carota subsp. sativus]|uniref:Uncharacterized protein n=1 Tax=Daucus carota subsp. sativus TaxID=79200 RepID=A0A166F229_DAUCS|nr:hypothetical protein DCAR_0209129 [Daucus carota subsp. sativus]
MLLHKARSNDRWYDDDRNRMFITSLIQTFNFRRLKILTVKMDNNMIENGRYMIEKSSVL